MVAKRLAELVQLMQEPRMSTGWPAGKIKPLTVNLHSHSAADNYTILDKFDAVTCLDGCRVGGA
jgi:hypothetical protein